RTSGAPARGRRPVRAARTRWTTQRNRRCRTCLLVLRPWCVVLGPSLVLDPIVGGKGRDDAGEREQTIAASGDAHHRAVHEREPGERLLRGGSTEEHPRVGFEFPDTPEATSNRGDH